jgi:hypothetical protein
VLLVCLVWWLAALLPASVPNNTPHALRSLNALAPMALLIGWGMVVFGEWCLTRWWRMILGMGYAILTVLFTIQFGAYYFFIYPTLSARDWQNGYTQLARELTTQKDASRADSSTEFETYILPFDDRFYLWLMGYGPYTATDFHHWQSRSYQFSDAIPHMHFAAPTALQVEQSLTQTGRDHQLVRVAGRPEQLANWQKNFQQQVQPQQQLQQPQQPLRQQSQQQSAGISSQKYLLQSIEVKGDDGQVQFGILTISKK